MDGDSYLTTYSLDNEGNVLTEDQYANAVGISVTASTTLSTVLANTTASAADRITTFTYDDDGQRLTETRDDVEASTVNNLGQLSTALTDSTVTFTYNGEGEVTSETQATGDYTDYSYDDDGRLTAETTTPFISYAGPSVTPQTLFYYDGLDNVTMTAVGNAGVALSQDHITQNTYGAGGRLATTTDASGFEETFGYDAAGDTVESSYQRLQSDGWSVLEAETVDYDSMGRQISSSVADYVGGAWSFGDVNEQTYDAYGEVVSKGVNGGAQVNNSYDAAGHLVSSNAQNGSLSVFVNDADGNQTLEIDSAGTSLAGDTVAEALALVVGEDGAPIQASGVIATFTVYDGRDNTTETIKPFRQLNQDETGDTATITEQKVYDAFGDVVQDTDAAGAVTSYSFNSMGDLSQQQDPLVDSTSASGVTTEINPTLNYFYDVSGRQVASEDANGNVTTTVLLAGTGYNGNTATVLKQFNPDGGFTLNEVDVWGNTIITSDALGDATEYAYDAMNRMISQTTGLSVAVPLYGTSGANVLQGGSYEQGNGGADTFIYDEGYGDLVINEYNSGTNDAVLQFGSGITESSIAVRGDGSGDLIISDGLTNGQVTISSALLSANWGVGSVEFSDGTALTREQLIALATTGSPSNTILYGSTGADTFNSMGYAHYAQGDGGADTFIYDEDYGQLEISEQDGVGAVLQMGSGISASSITVTNDGSGNMLITDGVTGDQIKVDDEFDNGSASAPISGVTFSDGSSLTAAQLFALATTGSPSNNGTLFGTSGADTFDSQGYSHSEGGEGGADTFIYDIGYGNLEINESSGASYNASNAILQLGAGITASSISVSEDSAGDMILTDGVNGDQIKVDNEFNVSSGWDVAEWGVNQVDFADGSSLTRAQLLALTTTGSAANDGPLYNYTSAAVVFDSRGYAHSAQSIDGDDTFIYDQDYGYLEINESTNVPYNASTAVLQMGAGITASSISVSEDSAGDMILTDGVNGDQIKVDQEFDNSSYSAAEWGVGQIDFSDGSSLTRAQLISLLTVGSPGNSGTLNGTSGADTFDSQGFSHLEVGDGGADTFIYDEDYSYLEINEDSGANYNASTAILQMGAGISASSIAVSTDSSGDMIITDGVTGDQIKVDNEFNLSSGWGVNRWGVSAINFSDGSSLSVAELQSLADAGGTPTTYTASSYPNTFNETGPAVEVGSGGSDTFIYDEGYGQLEINEDTGSGSTASTAVLQLGSGVSASSIVVTSDSTGDMIISDGVTGDQIKVDSEFANSFADQGRWGVGQIDFADGSSLTRDQLIALETTGSQGNDGPLYGTTFGATGAETFDSQGYAHDEIGNGGADTFVYDEDYGYLEINEDSGSGGVASSAVLQMGAGITASSMAVSEDSAGDLIITDGVNGDRILVDSEFDSSSAGEARWGVSQIDFADGSSLTRAQLIGLLTTGSQGNDGPLYGTSGAETFDGQGYAHYEQGNGGADTFVYGEGYGYLEINESSGFSGSASAAVLQLGAGITASSITVSNDRSGNMIITDGLTGDQIKVDGEFNDNVIGVPEYGVSQVEFSDGTSLDLAQLQALTMTGALANDSGLYGTSDADTIDSRGYDQYAQGNGGADTFIYDAGYGQLEINEDTGSGSTASTAVLQMGSGITASSIIVTSDSTGDMIITDGTAGDQITIDGELNNSVVGIARWGVSEVDFADGTSLTRAQLITLAATGSHGNDGKLYGTSGADTFDSQGKAYYAQGNGGADTFLYSQGYGALEINEDAGSGTTSTAVLQFGSDVLSGSVQFSTDGAGDLIISDGVTGDTIKIDGEFNGALGRYGVAEVDFTSGLSLDRDQLLALATPPNQLTTDYTYNGLGERLTETNSVFGPTVAETTDYDSQGRVTKTVDFDGNVTSYAYAYDADLATSGMGTFGGWIETETNSTGLNSTTEEDYFGRTVTSTDFGDDVYADTYDAAGRLVSQTMTNASDVLATTTDNSYYNTGALSGVSMTYGWATNGIASTQSAYSYDVEGNRLTETYTGTTDGDDPTTVSYEDATATYDALNRMVSYSDSGQSSDYPITIDYLYDANSNIRNMTTTSVSLTGAGTVTQDYWYLYDSMNRFTTTEGTLVDGAIVRGSTGTDIAYNLAGERTSETTTIAETTEVDGDYVSWNDDHIESFTYTSGGYLANASISDGTYDAATGTVVQGPAYLAAVDVRDALGRAVNYIEYGSNGQIYYSEQSTFDNDNNVTSQTENTRQSDGSTLVDTTTYDYLAMSGDGTYDGAYLAGEVTHSHESAYTISGGSETDHTTSDTVNSYDWNSAPYQTGITYTSSAFSATNSTSFTYDAADNLVGVDISDGTPSTIVYTTNAQGEVMSKVESSSNSTNPESYYYYFNGEQLGEITNDGAEQVEDYAQAIAVRSAQAQEGPFEGGETSPTAYAAFGDAYQQITPTSQGSGSQASSSYTVQSGDTIATIANQLWGDSSLWYLIADANGLSGSASLAPGQVLSIPTQVTNVHNNSATFTVYDASKAIGDVQPLNPPPASGGSGACGVFGEILEIIVAVLVIFVAPEAGALAETAVSTAIGGGAGAAAGVAAGVAAAGAVGAAGSALEQGIGIATGLQSSFNWGQVGIGALEAGLTFGLAPAPTPGPPTLATLVSAAERAAAVNVAVQGVELATRMQKSFSWSQLTTAVVVQTVGADLGGINGAVDQSLEVTSAASPLAYIGAGITGVAQALAGAATQSALTGSNFGKNFEDDLPSALEGSIGSAISEQFNQSTQSTQSAQASNPPSAGGNSGSSNASQIATGLITAPEIVTPITAELAPPLQIPQDLQVGSPNIVLDADQNAPGNGVSPSSASSANTNGNNTVDEIVVTGQRSSTAATYAYYQAIAPDGTYFTDFDQNFNARYDYFGTHSDPDDLNNAIENNDLVVTGKHLSGWDYLGRFFGDIGSGNFGAAGDDLGGVGRSIGNAFSAPNAAQDYGNYLNMPVTFQPSPDVSSPAALQQQQRDFALKSQGSVVIGLSGTVSAGIGNIPYVGKYVESEFPLLSSLSVNYSGSVGVVFSGFDAQGYLSLPNSVPGPGVTVVPPAKGLFFEGGLTGGVFSGQPVDFAGPFREYSLGGGDGLAVDGQVATGTAADGHTPVSGEYLTVGIGEGVTASTVTTNTTLFRLPHLLRP